MLQQLLLRASPSVLGSLLVGAVGSQQASQIQKDLAVVQEGFETMKGLKCSGGVTMMHREGFVDDDGSTVVSDIVSVC